MVQSGAELAEELLNLPFKLIFGEAQQGLNFLNSEDILWMGSS